ncbi:MAG TPA: DUF2059 domain-containing protein [Candidatus Angelobacter sp.]|nr:DUF2059 domain-containing protein [Candidatus Angelobacter sp.]
MKRILLTSLLCLVIGIPCFAQQSPSDAPATKVDIQKYLDAMHSREMMTKMVDAMSKPLHQMLHEQYLRDRDKLPADFEERMNKVLDDYLTKFPWDEMLDAMVPVYQKHFTKGDVDALLVFYSSPTGQKMIRELPAISAESMQVVMPLVQKQMASITEHVQQEVAQMIKNSEGKPAPKS